MLEGLKRSTASFQGLSKAGMQNQTVITNTVLAAGFYYHYDKTAPWEA